MPPKKTTSRHLHKRLQGFPRARFANSIPRVRAARGPSALKSKLPNDLESTLAPEVTTAMGSGYHDGGGCPTDAMDTSGNLGAQAGYYPNGPYVSQVGPTQEVFDAYPTQHQLESDQNAYCKDYRTFNIQTAQPSSQLYALQDGGPDLVHSSTGWVEDGFIGDPSHIPYGRTHGRISGAQNHFAEQVDQGINPQTGHSISGAPAMQFSPEELVEATRASEMWPCQWPSQGPASVDSALATPRETAQITNLHGSFVQVAWVPNGIRAMESSNRYSEGTQFSSGGISSYQESGGNVWPSGNAN